MTPEDPLSRIHREYREECIRLGTYKPFTDEELARAVQKWRAKLDAPPIPKPGRRRKKGQ